jgi:hypothetical protein
MNLTRSFTFSVLNKTHEDSNYPIQNKISDISGYYPAT